MSTVGGILVGLILLSLMMFVHELGHFLVGRKLGFTIIEFSIFMGPRLLSWERKGIRYSLKLIPIGASVQFAGEFNTDPKSIAKVAAARRERPGDFYARPKSYRAAVAFAGPAVNLLCGILAFAILFSFLGSFTNEISGVGKKSMAEAAGLEVGDKLLKLNGRSINNELDMNAASIIEARTESFRLEFLRKGKLQSVELKRATAKFPVMGVELQKETSGLRIKAVDASLYHHGDILRVNDLITSIDGKAAEITTIKKFWETDSKRKMPLTVERNGEKLSLVVEPTMVERSLPWGIELKRDRSILYALPRAVIYSASIFKLTFISIGKMITGALSARENLSGPIGVVTAISGVVTTNGIPLAQKLCTLLSLFGLISLSLGIMNLLPIPPLDGNLLLLTALEAIRGRTLTLRTQTAITVVGMIVVILLLVLGFYFDICRLLGV